MARKEYPDQRKARVKTSEGQVPDPQHDVSGDSKPSYKKHK